MAISLSSLRRTSAITPIIGMVYGSGGTGKTTLFGSSPSPVLVQLEDGAGLLDLPTFGLLQKYGDVMDAIGSLYGEAHDFKSVVVDSIDWLEPIVQAETCRRNGWKDIEEPGYGRGYTSNDDTWRELLSGFRALRDEKGMSVLYIAHTEVRRYESPTTEPYDRFQPKLHKRASALFQEHVDMMLFMNFRTSIVRDQQRGDKKGEGRARGVGGGTRVVYTEERPAFLAKNRWSMPDSIDLPDDPAGAWPTLAAHIPYFNTNAALAAE